MSIGILVKVHDGVVLAADSASTISVLQQRLGQDGKISHEPAALNVYNNANKIVNLFKGLPIGCVAYGAGSIGSASTSTLLKDFRNRLRRGGEEEFSARGYTVQDVSRQLSAFLMSHIANLGPDDPKPTIGIMIAGYSADKSLPEGWLLVIENGIPKELQLIRSEGDVGITWGGEGESLARLVLGFSPLLPSILSQVIVPNPSASDMEQLTILLRNRLQAPLVLPPMPIQDAIDLAEWLVQTASMFSRFMPGPPSVGGPIESAAITKHEGFKWVHRKYYYESRLNPEVQNGDPDGQHQA